MKYYLLIFAAISCVASLPGSTVRSEHHHIDASTIQITKEGILYQASHGDYQITNRLFCDDQGIYVMGRYQCPACGRWATSQYCVNHRCHLYGK